MILNPFYLAGSAIYCVRSGQVLVGVDATGAWQLSIHGDVMPLLDNGSMLYVLPLLEDVTPPKLLDLERMLSHALGAPVMPFPISDLLHQAFSGVVSEYWVGHALSWIKLGAKLDERLLSDIARNVNNKALSQGVRQQLKKLLRS